MKVNKNSNFDEEDKLRMIQLYKRLGLFGNDRKGTTIKRALTQEELLKAYKLIHDVFVKEQYMHPNNIGVRLRPFEMNENTATFIAKKDNDVVAAISIIPDCDIYGLPADKVYGDITQILRLNDAIICEGSGISIHPDYRKSTILTELIRCMFAHCCYANYDKLITAISPHHQKFYELGNFNELSDIRSYSKHIDDPTILMGFDVTETYNLYYHANHFDKSSLAFFSKYWLTDNKYFSLVEQWDREFREYYRKYNIDQFLQSYIMNN